jgi:hypothetical protein
VAHDIVRLTDQFGFAEARCLDKLVVEIDQLPLDVGLGGDQDIVADRMFDVSDGKVSFAWPRPGMKMSTVIRRRASNRARAASG